MKKILIISLIFIFFVGVFSVSNKVLATDMSTRDFVQLLINIGVIDSGRIPTLNVYLESLGGPVIPLIIPNTSNLSTTTKVNIESQEQPAPVVLPVRTKSGWEVSNTGNLIDYYFTVEAQGKDYNVLSSSIIDSSDGTATVSAGALTRYSGDTVQPVIGGFTVSSGNKTTFRIRYSVSGINGVWAEVKLTSIVGRTVPRDLQTSPTATISFN
jgi:hypothetical protein